MRDNRRMSDEPDPQTPSMTSGSVIAGGRAYSPMVIATHPQDWEPTARQVLWPETYNKA